MPEKGMHILFHEDNHRILHKGSPPKKRNVYFRALPESGGGALARKFWPSFHQVLIPKILLLESPCPLVRSSVDRQNFSCSCSWCVRRSLSARMARRTKSSWPEGPPTRSWGPEGPLTSSFKYSQNCCIIVIASELYIK